MESNIDHVEQSSPVNSSIVPIDPPPVTDADEETQVTIISSMDQIEDSKNIESEDGDSDDDGGFKDAALLKPLRPELENDRRHEGTKCRWYRVVEFTDKRGGEDELADEKENILRNDLDEPVTFETGDWFLNDTDTQPSGTTSKVLVTNINGIQGSISTRRLQRVRNPWGLPTHLQLIEPHLEDTPALSTLKLAQEAEARGLKHNERTRTDILADIRAHDVNSNEQLPLMRVQAFQASGAYGSDVDFEAGEIVWVGHREDGRDSGMSMVQVCPPWAQLWMPPPHAPGTAPPPFQPSLGPFFNVCDCEGGMGRMPASNLVHVGEAGPPFGVMMPRDAWVDLKYIVRKFHNDWW